MEQDIQCLEPGDGDSKKQNWTQVAIRQDFDDTWTGNVGESSEFDPEMFANTPPLQEADKPYNWMEVGMRSNEADEETWARGGGWDND